MCISLIHFSGGLRPPEPPRVSGAAAPEPPLFFWTPEIPRGLPPCYVLPAPHFSTAWVTPALMGPGYCIRCPSGHRPLAEGLCLCWVVPVPVSVSSRGGCRPPRTPRCSSVLPVSQGCTVLARSDGCHHIPECPLPVTMVTDTFPACMI